jgi:hypothetical protein
MSGVCNLAQRMTIRFMNSNGLWSLKERFSSTALVGVHSLVMKEDWLDDVSLDVVM